MIACFASAEGFNHNYDHYGNAVDNYDAGPFFDEMFEPSGQIRTHYDRLYQRLQRVNPEEFERKRSVRTIRFSPGNHIHGLQQ